MNDYEIECYLVFFYDVFRRSCKKFETAESAIEYAKGLERNAFISIVQQRKMIIDIDLIKATI